MGDYKGGNLAEARVGYREYSGDPIALCVARTRIQGWCRIRGEVSHWGGIALGWCLEGCA